MRALNVRYRHDVFCPHRDCGNKIICAEGDVSVAVHGDGSPVSLSSFNILESHMFEITCAAHHLITVHFPKDVMIVKTPDLSAPDECPPAVLRV
jgi:hypothetical protein